VVNGAPQLQTPGVIADELGVPVSRVLYVLQKRSHDIRPIGRAGVLRLYDRAAVEMVRNELQTMDQRHLVVNQEGRRD
jgi:hypothetical protein